MNTAEMQAYARGLIAEMLIAGHQGRLHPSVHLAVIDGLKRRGVKTPVAQLAEATADLGAITPDEAERMIEEARNG